MSAPAPRHALRVAPYTSLERVAIATTFVLLAGLLAVAFASDGRSDFWKLLPVSVGVWALVDVVERAVRRRRVDRCLSGGADGRPWRTWGWLGARPSMAWSAFGLFPAAAFTVLGDAYAAPMTGLLMVSPLLVPIQRRDLRRFDALAERHHGAAATH